MTRRRFSLAVPTLTLILLLATVVPAAAQLPPGGSFDDDDHNTHEAHIEAIADAGITKGCWHPNNRLYCPNDTVTRGQMAAFLTRALNLPSAPDQGFSDTADSTYRTDIDALAAAGITQGCRPDRSRFCPSSPVTRGEMAAFLTRAFDLPAADDHPFVDARVPFTADIAALHAAGITTGCQPDRYCPGSKIRRDEMASFLTRGLGLDPIEPPPPPATRFHGIGTDTEQWRVLIAAHFPASQVDRAVNTAKCESGGNRWADNGRDVGLFQVWQAWAPHYGYSRSDLYDPIVNLTVARKVWDAAGWAAWVCKG